ncbi:MAG: serine/threonine-protein kinase [Pseudomonadales bacterium]
MQTDMHFPGFEIIKKLDEGGMARVYLAKQVSVDRLVALKIIDAPPESSGSEFEQRFNVEAKIVAGLAHPHIGPVHEFGRSGNYFFLSMEYVPGGTLSDRISKGITPKQADKIVVEIAAALCFAHQKGIVHRDIKPDNIMFREDGSTVLMDFGIARAVRTKASLTQKGMVLGTPLYMSPQQAAGQNTGSDVDVYALGIIYYEMLTGKRPYEHDDPQQLARLHYHAPLPVLPQPLKYLQPMLDIMLAKEIKDRIRNGADLIKVLESYRSDLGFVLDVENDEQWTMITDTGSTDNAKSMIIAERPYRDRWFRRRYCCFSSITASDANHFSVIFSTVTSHFVRWASERKKSAKKIELQCCIDLSLATAVKKRINFFFENDPHDCLKNIEVKVSLALPSGKIFARL